MHDILSVTHDTLYPILILTRIAHCKIISKTWALIGFFKSAWNWALWVCLIFIWIKTMSQSLSKLTKRLLMHLLWVITETCYQYISILYNKHPFQDQLLLSPFYHLHNPHNSLTNIVDLWCYCIKQCPKMNWNREIDRALNLLTKFSWIIHLQWPEGIFSVATYFLDENFTKFRKCHLFRNFFNSV